MTIQPTLATPASESGILLTPPFQIPEKISLPFWVHAENRCRCTRISTMSNTAPGASRSPIIDTSLGLLSTGGDSELLNELVSIFVQSVPAQLVRITAALASGNSTQVRHEAHSLKGASAALGAIEIQKLAAEIEVLADRSDVAPIPALVETIERLMARPPQEHAAI